MPGLVLLFLVGLGVVVVVVVGGFGNGILNLGPVGTGLVLAVSGAREGALNGITGRLPCSGVVGRGVVTRRGGGRSVGGDLLSADSGVFPLTSGAICTDVVGVLSKDDERVGSGLSVGSTNVRTTVVVMELKIRVVVVTVVVASSGSEVVSLVSSTEAEGSDSVPSIVRLPMIVETNVLGAMVVVKTDVIVSGLSLV